MSELLEVREKLQDTHAAITRLERTLAQYPDEEPLLINLQSLVKRRERLEEDFTALASKTQVDVCTYRFTQNGHPATIRGLTRALSDFQEMVSLTYDAIEKGPRQERRTSPEADSKTSLGFGYAFVGSVGFVLTLPRELALIDQDNSIDRAVGVVLAMTKASQASEISGFARLLGPAPIRSLYRWASDHFMSGLGADIQWRRHTRTDTTVLVQEQELERLRGVLESTSEEVEERFQLSGVLVGADVSGKKFHLEVAGGQDIRGTFTDAISPDHVVTLPSHYTAYLLKRTQIRYSTEKEEVSYHLLQLEPV